MNARATVLAIAACAAAALAGCGERRDTGFDGTVRTSPAPAGRAQPTLPAEAVAAAEVSLVDFRLAPSNVRVAQQGVIAFVATNDGQARHALEVVGPAGEIRSKALAPGERATIAVELPPGTYKWFCPLGDHERRGMQGRVRVAE